MTTPGQQIEVDLLALQQTRDAITENTNNALQSGISDARGRIFRGLPVGERSASGEVDASRQAMADAIHCFWKNSEAYVKRAKVMTEFLAKTLEEYRTADDFARLSVDAVTQKLDDLQRALPARPQPARVRGDLE